MPNTPNMINQCICSWVFVSKTKFWQVYQVVDAQKIRVLYCWSFFQYGLCFFENWRKWCSQERYIKNITWLLFYLLFSSPMADFRPLLRVRLTNPKLVTTFYLLQLESVQELCSEVGSKGLVKHLEEFEPGALQFWM